MLSENKISYLKNLHKPIMGWVSIYTPEEIIYAAGIMPFRITGERGASNIKSRSIFSTNICSYVLSSLEEALEGEYGFLSGIVLVNACDARRRLYDIWRMYINTPFIYFIDFPKIFTPQAKDYFAKQILLFKNALEAQFDYRITDDSLKTAISLWNETRMLLSRLYELRKNPHAPICGSDVMSIIKAGMGTDKEDFNEKLRNLLNALSASQAASDEKKCRVLITGSFFDHPLVVKLIEELGATIVCEDLSNGIKYFEGSVSLDEEPIEALASYYLGKATSARMVDSEKRSQHLLKLINEYHVDAVIYFSLKFCDSNLIDFPYQRTKVLQNNVPILFLELERSSVNLNNLRTRIQAFLEINGF